MSPNPEALAFDVYGTLVDPIGIRRDLERHLPAGDRSHGLFDADGTEPDVVITTLADLPGALCQGLLRVSAMDGPGSDSLWTGLA